MTYLIVDDSDVMRVVIKELLVGLCRAKEGDMHEASGGVEAIRKYKLLRPDLVFLDVFMPRVDGKEVVVELMKFDPNAKIIMCTSAAEKEYVVDCMRAGALDYITKPPIPKRFLAAVLRILGNVFIENAVENSIGNSIENAKEPEENGEATEEPEETMRGK